MVRCQWIVGLVPLPRMGNGGSTNRAHEQKSRVMAKLPA
jgi:hypothetical protein